MEKVPADHVRSLNIGILGCRGVPNRYGGYEQFAEYLSLELIRRGHRVTVYQSGRHPWQASEWQGVQLARCYDPEGWMGTAGQFVYDWLCLRDARRRSFDVLLQLGYTSNAIWHPLWPRGAVNIIHMDGLEWQRTKYRPVVRRFLRYMESLAVKYGDILIADSPAIAGYLEHTYGKRAPFISYGASIPEGPDPFYWQQFGVSPGRYLLCICRLVPENHVETIIRGAFESGNADPLLVVGDPSTPLGRRLVKQYEGSRVHFTGGLFDKAALDTLRTGARIYLHGHSVGGTNPSLLEAMACGVPVAAHDNPFNRAVLGEAAFYFKTVEDIAGLLRTGLSQERTAPWTEENLRKIRENHRWDLIADACENLFIRACEDRNRRAGPSV